jgi:ribonuclease HI
MIGTQQSLLNDDHIQDHTMLLITEPHCFVIDGKPMVTPQRHSHWTPILPSRQEEGRWPFRSMIWTHHTTNTTPILIDSSDITAVLMKVQGRIILTFSVYIPSRDADENEALETRLKYVSDTIYKTRQEQHPQPVELLITGDFNRHDQLWGGDEVSTTPRQGEASPIIDFMVEFDLQHLLPRGTMTYESTQGSSCIDLTLATPRLTEERMSCKIYHTEHGSDHRAIDSNFAITIPSPKPEPGLAWDRAPWDNIKKEIALAIPTLRSPICDLDGYTAEFVTKVSKIIYKLTPRRRPSPYTKRWWTAELAQQRTDYTYWRNRACSNRKAGIQNEELETRVRILRQDFHRNIQKQKRQHWNSFLDDVQNIWQASRFLQPENTTSITRIPSLISDDGGTINNHEELASTLLESFFPPPAEVIQTTRHEAAIPGNSQLILQAITMSEIKRAIFAAKPHKAPGLDGLPARVWQKVWPTCKEIIYNIFQTSLDRGEVPACFKVAKIIPLRKPDKPDYRLPGAYRPISLLSSLGKALESVIAQRISYLAETHDLLPHNHFGGRKRRSTVQALTILQERIWDAWREQKVLSLVSFDVKGAFNGVNTEVLLHRLRKRQIPEQLIQWINSFCKDRKAVITINSQDAPLKDLGMAGLPQGSPLSPILFLFFNADLVQSVINKHQGSVAFIDDFSAWVTGETPNDTTNKLQEKIINKAEEWEKNSGATFQPEKTIFIHFTRNLRKAKSPPKPLIIGGCHVLPSNTAKLLGVVMDQQLRFTQHVARTAKRGLQVAMALKRLKSLRPAAVRQLFCATVAPVVDYASFIWSTNATKTALQMLQPIQRVGAQAITGVFRTVALPIAEAEASIDTIRARHYQQSLRTWVDLHTLPKSHPFWKTKKRVDRKTLRFISPLQRYTQQFTTIEIRSLETISPYPIPPWYTPPEVIIQNRETAIADTQERVGTWDFYTDASLRKGHLGISAWHKTGVIYSLIGTDRDLNVYYGEMMAIYRVIHSIEAASRLWPPDYQPHFTIFSDSQTALTSILKPRIQSGQHIITAILESLEKLRARQVNITLRWVPAHSGVIGNEKAHQAAQSAASNNLNSLAVHQQRLKSSTLLWARSAIPPPEKSDKDNEYFSKHTDQALPGKHTKALYNTINKNDASILAQLRTGKCRLNHYLYRINAVESDICECGRHAETVKHFLFQCPRWEEKRNKMRSTFPHRFGDLSFWIGGWSNQQDQNGRYIDGPKSRWKPNLLAVKLTIEFTKETKRLEHDHTTN